MISVIIPAYNEEAMIAAAAAEISGVMAKENIPCQLIFVDDGSTDATWERISKVCSDTVLGLHFSRNFGKEAAMFAGLERAEGDCCAVIDCDLQHPPEKLVEMYRLWEQGFEVIEGIKADRGSESVAHRFAAKSFYGIISKTTGMDMSDASDFKLLDRKVVDALNSMPERSVFFRALSYWVGFKKATVSYCVRERSAGESKWSTGALIKYAVKNITSFSSAPLNIITGLGVLMLLISLIFSIISLVQKLTGLALGGFTTVIILLLFASSVIMISLGIIGLYISKIYEEVKGRPRYIVSQECGGNEDKK